MNDSDRPSVRPRGRPLLLIAVIAIVIVAAVAVAGAYVLTNNGPGADDGSSFVDDGADNADAPDSNDPGDLIERFDLKAGDYVEFTADSELLGLTQTSIIRLTVTSVTPSGHDVTLRMTTGSEVQESTFRANSTEELIAGVAGGSFSRGEMLGEGNLSTPYGAKKVEHWRTDIVTDEATNVTDYYVGVSTGMVYRIDIVSTGSDMLGLTTTTVAVLTDTNIDAVKAGDPA